MNYTDYKAALSQMTGLKDANGQVLLNALLPRIIEYAELRLLRDPDLVFLATETADSSQLTTTGKRTVTIPPQFVVVEEVRLVTPANTKLGTAGATRVGLLRVSRDFIDMTWPQESDVAPPAPFSTSYALWSQQSQTSAQGDNQPPSAIRIAPTPDAEYVTEFLGTFRPVPLSAANPVTFISQFLPDLMISASMIFCEGSLKKNFGSQSDDPRAAVSWEAIYSEQKKSASVEVARQRMRGVGFSVDGPMAIANLPRTSMLMPGAPSG